MAILAAVSSATTSCHLLHIQKARAAESTSAKTATSPPDTEEQVPAPALTPSGEIDPASHGLPLPLAPTLPGDPGASFTPAVTPSPGVYVPSPGEVTSPPGDEDALPPPPPPPAAELRGLRSPKLPSNLPMSLDGKLIQ